VVQEGCHDCIETLFGDSRNNAANGILETIV